MLDITNTNSDALIVYLSSLRNECLSNQAGPDRFIRWYFDALSDDGRESLTICFYDTCPLSKRYVESSDKASIRFPSVSLTYSVEGNIVMRATNEYGTDDIAADPDGNGCVIGGSSFRYDKAEYGSGFFVVIDLVAGGNRRIKAELEWLSVESDLLECPARPNEPGACWNFVAPRSDVSGRLTLEGRRGKKRKMVHFRGTGYHDRFQSGRVIDETLGARAWGRAHFVDSTVIFQRPLNAADESDPAKLFLIRDGAIHERSAAGELQNYVRDRFGLKVPMRLSLLTDDNIRLRVKPLRVIDTGFVEKRMVSEFTLMLRDGKPRKTLGIAAFTAPGRLKHSVFRWLHDQRVRRRGHGTAV